MSTLDIIGIIVSLVFSIASIILNIFTFRNLRKNDKW